MTTIRMTFTCAPDPRKTAAPRLTVLVSPRLEGQGSLLSHWPLGVWPDLLKAATISVLVDGASVPVTPAFDLDRDVWNTMFGPSTPVTPYVYADDQRPIRSYPVKQIEGTLHSIYGNVAASYPRDPAPMFYGSGEGTPIGQFVGLLLPIERWLRGGPDWQPISFTPAEDDPSRFLNKYQKALYDANRFYLRRPVTVPVPDNQRPPPPEHDFHARVAMLADHPTLLRKLGLAFDLTLPAGVLASSGAIKLVIDWRGAGSPLDRCPTTRYVFSSGRFMAQAQTGALDRGYLRPIDATGAKAIEATILDTDGGAIQSVAFALAAQGACADPTRPPVEATTLPTLRTAGITLVHNARKDWLGARRTATAALESQAGNALLWAEDLLRGYRIDVDDGSGTWRSLCRRQGSIAITGRTQPVPVPPEEGYVKAASAASASGSNELYLHEALAGWEGWSLVTRRPGRTVVFDPDLHKDVVVPVDNHDSAALGVAAEYRPAGALPRLRYGKSYRLRVRTVDVAGGSVEAEDGESSYVVGPVAFARYEPIAPPVLVPRAPYKEASSIERMVVRTPGYQPGPIIGMPMLTPDDRHVLPPRATLAMAELHGKLDGAFAAGADRDAWYQVARKEMGTLFDPMVVDLAAGTTTAVSPAPQLVAPQSSLSTTPPSLPSGRGDPIGAGQYVVHAGDEVRLPYLPDPMAAGILLYDPTPAADSTGPEIISMGFPFDAVPWAPSLSDWPNKRSLRLVVQPTLNGSIVRDAPGGDLHTMVFQLPPGRRLSVRYSSLPYDDLTTMALFNLIAATAPSNVLADMHAGLHGMLTPARTIEMVHATQRPVRQPTWGLFRVYRGDGDTFVTMSGHPDHAAQSGIDVHSWSTSHIDMRAQWNEWVDDGVDPAGLRVIPHSAEAFRLPVVEGVDLTRFEHTTQPVERRLASPVGLAPARLIVDGTQPAAITQPARHELGDTRHRVIDYTPVATTRYAEYFPADVIADHTNLEVDGETRTLIVPSSRPPAPPRILYAVPTFAWQGSGHARTRVGRGLRIYLDRPWFQTGAEERLAVILAPENGTFDDSKVSKWGTDPAWTSAATPLLADAFPDPGETINYLGKYPYPRMAKETYYLSETNHNVRVVGYLPEWNAERKLWYVDIELASGNAYWPFVSLALARWQPHALFDGNLSKIVRLHFTQIAPDRAATITPNGSSIAVHVSGVTAGNSLEYVYDEPGPWLQFKPRRLVHDGSLAAAHRVTARLEQLPASLAAGDPANQLRWTTVAGPLELKATDGATAGEVQWNGTLGAPTTPGALRVVVTETEMYASDTGTTVLLEGYGQARGRERVVYMDSLDV